MTRRPHLIFDDGDLPIGRAEPRPILTNIQKRALQYVANTDGGATHAVFLDDHDPIGHTLWEALAQADLVTIIAERIYVTPKGLEELK
jgi:hypothetical protein